MPNISKKAIEMPSSPIRKLVPFSDAAKAAGKKVFHLNIGQPDIKTPQVLFDAVSQAKIEVLAYINSKGRKSYREKLALYYNGFGSNIDSEDIIVTTGGSEALYFGMFTCLDPGDEVILPEPFYANYNGFSRSGDIAVKTITSSIENGFALPPIESFEDAIGSKTKAILICNPSNPTGYLYSKQELNVLREIVLKHDLFVFADEVYREFVYDGKTHTSILSLEGMDENAVVVDSISKRYSACGARLGALISKNQELIAGATKFAQARLSPPTWSELAGEAALSVPMSYFDEVVSEYTNRRDALVNRLNAMDGVNCPTPGGAFYCMAHLPVVDTDHFCQWMLESFDHNGATVMMAPGSGFYYTKGLGKSEVRIAYVLNEEDLMAAMDCLEAGLKAYPRA